MRGRREDFGKRNKGKGCTEGRGAREEKRLGKGGAGGGKDVQGKGRGEGNGGAGTGKGGWEGDASAGERKGDAEVLREFMGRGAEKRKRVQERKGVQGKGVPRCPPCQSGSSKGISM